MATLDEFNEDALVRLLTEPKDAVLEQFQKLFTMEGAELDVTPAALHSIASKALKRKTGARGVRSIVEQALFDTMYDLPTTGNVAKVMLDADAIDGTGKLTIVYNERAQVCEPPARKEVRDALA